MFLKGVLLDRYCSSYINDILSICDDAKVELYLYAVDAKLHKVVKSHDDILVLQACLDRLFDWCELWNIG